MKKLYKFFFLVFTIGSISSMKAQVTGIKNIPTDYPTLEAAISALNTNGVGPGGATINIPAGYVETPTAALVLTMATNSSSASRPLVFQKSGAGANPLITAFTGVSTTLDALFVLNGVDYVTVNGIDLQENAANTTATTQMEFGYAFLKTSVTNGCQYNTIKNCVVSLNKANTASVGIYSANHTIASITALTITSFSGTNSYNKLYNNTVQNCYGGYALIGFASVAPFDLYDQRNEIGIDGVSSNLSQVLDFGGSTVAVNGILANNQNAVKIFNTTVSNGNTTNSGTINGISLLGGTNSNIDVFNNTVTVSSGASTSIVNGISNASGGTGSGNVVNIYNNTITGSNFVTATTAEYRGIASTSTASYTNIYGNTVSNNTLAGTGNFSAIYYGGSSATLCLIVNLNNNTINNNTKTGTGGAFQAIYASSSTNTTNAFSNSITNNSNALSNGATYGYYNFAFALNENVYNNTITNLIGGTGETVVLDVRSGSGPTNKEVYGNSISVISGNTTANSVGGIRLDYSTISNVYKNNIYNITNNAAIGAAGAAFGVQIGINVNTFVSVYNNFISDLKAPSASNNEAINGIWLQGSASSTLNAYFNTVYLNASSSGANFGTSAINCATTGVSLDLRNNIFVNTSVAGGSGLTRGLTRGGAVLTNYALTSGYNCIYAGTPGASNLIFSDGTNFDQSLQAFKNRVGAREQASFSELPPFTNIASAPFDLHLQTTLATQCESGAKSIASVTIDYDGNTRSTISDVGADEFSGLTNDTASPDIQYVLLTNSSVATSRTLTAFANITDPSGINTTGGTNPRLYYKKSTQANTFNDNTSATDGWKYVEASNAVSPFNFTIDYSNLLTGSVLAGDVIQYFVTAQDLNATPRIGLNNGGFTTQPASVNLAAANFPLNNTINQFTILANTYSGTINVGPTETITSLTNAGGLFGLLNAGVVSGNITVNITGDLTAETGTNALNQWAEQGTGNYTITIAPSAGVTRLISGSNATTALIRLDGADRVLIDGRFSGSGSFLTFRNTSTATPTISFINDAQNNTLRNSIVESGNIATSATLGGAVFIGSTTIVNGNGNDNNTITNCEIRDRSDVVGTPAIGINCVGNSAGTLAQYNNNVTISNNNIHDWFLANNANQFGLQMGAGNSGFTISGNSFYQTATRTQTVSGAVIRAINISFTSTVATNGGHTITDNFIGGTAPGATGGDMTYTVSGAGVSQVFTGISVVSGLIPNSIQNNTIRKIDYTTNSPAAAASVFLGMNLGQGIFNVGTSTGNTIGDSTGNGAIKITINTGGSVNSFLAGILATGVNGYFNIQNNTIGGITIGGTTTAGGIIPQWIQVQGTPVQNTIISNNIIGSTSTPNSIAVTTVTPPVISFSIRHLISSGVGATISNNTIQNITNASTNSGSADYGMLFISTVGSQGTLNVTNNTIKDFTGNGSQATPAFGILGFAVQGYAGLTHNLSENTISGLNNANSGAFASYVIGIQTQGSSMGGIMQKNRIYDLRNSNTGASGIGGIYIATGLNWTLNNNRISISNGVGTNGLDLTGIAEFMPQNSTINMNYNSVYIGGTSTGTTNSIPFNHGGNATVSLKNNLLYNERTGGTGNHVAIASSSATPSLGWNDSDTNAFVTADGLKVGLWGTIANDFATWKTNSGTDANSVSSLNTTVTSADLFVSAPIADLRINTSIFPVGYATPIAITTDYEGDLRSVTDPTIGSDEKACAVNNGVTDVVGVLTATQTGATYQWYECPNILIPGAISQTFTPSASSDYKVVVTLGGCVTESNCVTYLGASSFELNTKFTMYPNPTNGIVNIQSDFDGDFILVNQIGQTVKSFKVVSNKVNLINIETLASGIYFVKGTDGYNVGVKKLIIK
jgi:hypothetical protein